MKVYSPLDGILIPLSEVNDPMFSKKMLGDGVAIVPKGVELYAPMDGTITMLFPSKHAIGLVSDDGLEILIHIGIDTVELKGEPFDVHIEIGDRVVKGEKIATIDINLIEKLGYDTTTPIICTKGKIKNITKTNLVNNKTHIFNIEEE